MFCFGDLRSPLIDFDADIFSRIKDVHTLANLIKRFIRDIPGSLMPHEIEDAVKQAMGKYLYMIVIFRETITHSFNQIKAIHFQDYVQ